MKKESRFWRNIERALMFVGLIGLMADNCNQRSQNNQYKEQLIPEIDCDYQYYTSNEKYKFIIHNVGLIDCENIWAQENIYLIINDNVYEGIDVPHLSYFVYQGSRNHMWDLAKGRKIESDIAELQIQAFHDLKEKFNSIVVSKWKIEFSKPATTKRYFYEKYFIYDFNDRNFKEPKDYVRGESYKSKISDYLSSGLEKRVEIFVLTGTFEIDPPRKFIITQDYSFIPLYPSKRISLETLNSRLLFSPGPSEIQPSDDIKSGTLRYGWEFENTRWQKFSMMIPNSGKYPENYSKPFDLADPISYLSPKDAQRVRSNPGLLKHLPGELRVAIRVDRRAAGFVEYFQILDKAREKFLKEKKGH